MSIFICPVCGKSLEKSGNSYRCADGHSFDEARSGYINLLLSKQQGKTVHGDNKLMLQARRSFLEKGYYSPLRDALCDAADKYFTDGALLDAGCGEGYYTTAISDQLHASKDKASIVGIDVSKIAADMAAKRHDGARYAAASVFHIPVSTSSCSMLVTLFAPYCGEEFCRVLRRDGIMIMAIPGQDHLWELKRKIYDIPYKNEVKPFGLAGFELLEERHIKYEMQLASQEDIQALFSMTPYYYRTGAEQQKRLLDLDSLAVTADFELLVYKKSNK